MSGEDPSRERRLVADGWRRIGTATARGTVVTDGEPRHPAAVFDGCRDATEVRTVAAESTGFFAAVVRLPDATALICDTARSVPLYFSNAGISDVGTELAAADPAAYDPVAASEFALTRYVTGGETLRPEVRGVCAGEMVVLPDDGSGIERTQHSRYRPTAETGDPAVGVERGDLLDRFGGVVGNVFDRVVAVADGRPVAVPLSGGWDSRLIATELVDRGVEVVAFTFGAAGHADVEVSRDVADALGVEWHWVEYTTERWRDWYHSDARRAYHDYAFGFDSLPFLAEWPAVDELTESEALPEDALVCPGHTVATPSERVPAAWVGDDTVTREDVVGHVFDSHYALWDWDDPELRERFAARIAEVAGLDSAGGERGDTAPLGGDEAAAAYEQWEWATRMSTFTNADCRLYEWFGYDWWLPLWDPEYVELWGSLPLSVRHDKSLQRCYARKRFAEVAGVDDATAARTDRDWTPFDQLRRRFDRAPERTHPDYSGEKGFEAWLGGQAVPPAAMESRGNYPLRWYGVFPEDAEALFAPARSLYALRTLRELGHVSFDPPRADVSISGMLSLPPV
ncbi:asparagine synthase [Halolamina sp. CBA1230]|uniref:asparagine synthase-related protein n=1 Tax=Halolamina sp. CBA1230 TaxID=1853690 RepID=UPI0009A1C886|nr:asparagine synthase-related protein [Halolamina sp. CBA1230]QKY20304.1 asparagine synthase [Halolamina sp. CBA1230]